MVEKGIFPYVSKQESAINAGESFFQVCVTVTVSCNFEILALSCIYKNLVDVYDEHLGNLKCF